jgi:Xaa-Pro aminopeptidase
LTTEILPDDAALRATRRERVLAAMEAADIDILITGREANARYVAGVPRLWLNGSRPFGPGCIYVRETGDIHLVSTWDEGVPGDIPHEHLHGITFNGANTVKMLQGVHGAAQARSVATDGLMPSTARLIRTAFPNAELVDGEQMLRDVRRIKLPEEVDGIRAAIGVAERALTAAEDSLVAGISGRQLTAIFMEAMANGGVTTPTTQDVARIGSRTEPWASVSRDAAISETDLVTFAGGVLANGYIGEVGRTRCIGGLSAVGGDLLATWDELWDRLLVACRPGAPGADLIDVYDDCGLPAPPTPVARGLGHGNDLPLISHALPKTAAAQTIEPGMVFALTGYVWADGVGAIYGQEPVLITESGPELLSARPMREPRS